MIGVFAHETGHIVGGHLSKMRTELANAQTASIIAMLLGVGALVAGARSSNADMGNIGSAVITAPQSYLMNRMLSYQRGQEESADRAGVRFLTTTGQSAKGMYDTFKRFADESLYSAHNVDPYAQNHPLPQERMAALAELVKTPYWDKKDPPELQFRHDMMRAKLYGFIERPDVVLRRYPQSDTSLPARYARAISTYRFGDVHAAVAQIDALIQAMPANPYFYELKGQALLEGGHPADALGPLRHAVQLAPNQPLLQILLGQALVATNDAKEANDAIPLLRAALIKEPEFVGRLRGIGHGLRPQERLRRGRSGIGPGRLRARRQQDRARTGGPRQAALSRRISRLGQSRRYCRFQQESRVRIRFANKNRKDGPMTDPMSTGLRPALFAALLAATTLFAPAASAQTFSDDQRHQIEGIIKDYLIGHPEVMQEINAAVDKHQQDVDTEKQRVSIKENNATLFSSPHQVVLGNPQGKLTMVEFFDYNCAFCKRAMSDMLDLLKNDHDIKFVLKEFPVLGEGSVDAAHVAVAARMQDPTGKKYIDFHQKLWRPRAGRQGPRHGGGQGGRLRHGAPREGHGERRGQDHDRRGHEARRCAGRHRHAELCGRQPACVGAVGLDTLKEKIDAERK